MKRLCLALTLCALPLAASAQEQNRKYAVELSAVVETNPPRISLRWPAEPTTHSYRIRKRVKGGPSWDQITPLDTLPGTATSWSDPLVQTGVVYEYMVRRVFPGSGLLAYGKIMCGIEVAEVEQRGTLLLLVDSSVSAALAPEIARLESDLVGDGWQVVRHEVSRTASVTDVKALIVSDYQNAPTEVKAVLLLGHLAVPYSGLMRPDGHPDHEGAWPADLFYGDVDGTWTDTTVNSTTASRQENWNVPGDGKYDQNLLPSDVELFVGRVDLSQQPLFGLSEEQLLRRYLDKNHGFRHKQFTAEPRGLIDDNFSYSFGANGWRDFATMFGPANVSAGDYFTDMATESYLWSYGCGPGGYGGAGGIGTTVDFSWRTVNTVFTVLFGSYFGDWDNENNFLRAPLAAQGMPLTCVWAGRPHWNFYPMALGETIGYCTRFSQNEYAIDHYWKRYAHVALMGDPTLRMHVVAPARALSATQNGAEVELSWTPSADAVEGYYVYRASSPAGPFTRVSQLVTSPKFTDRPPGFGTWHYGVRARRLETSASGSYRNLSQSVGAPVVFVDGPEIDVQRPGGRTIPSGGRDLVRSTGAPVSLIYTIENRGTQELHLGDPRWVGGGGLSPLPPLMAPVQALDARGCTVAVAQPARSTLRPGESLTFEARVSPSSLRWSFRLQVLSDDADEGRYEIKVVGEPLLPTNSEDSK